MSVTMKSKSHRSNIGHSGNGAFCEPFPFMRPTLPELGQVIAEYQSAYRNGVLTNADLVARLESAAAETGRLNKCLFRFRRPHRRTRRPRAPPPPSRAPLTSLP